MLISYFVTLINRAYPLKIACVNVKKKNLLIKSEKGHAFFLEFFQASSYKLLRDLFYCSCVVIVVASACFFSVSTR